MRHNENTAAMNQDNELYREMNPEDPFYMGPDRNPGMSGCLGMIFALASVAFTFLLLMP